MKRLLTVIVCVCWPGLVGCDQAKSVVRKALKNAAPEESEVGQVLVLDASTYEEFEQQQRRLVVVDFYADWCASCRQLEPILGRVTADFAGKAVVGKVNIAKEKQIAIDRGIGELPDIRFYLDGRQVDRMVGPGTEPELRKRFEQYTANIKADLLDAEYDGSPKEELKPLSEGWLPPGMERAKGDENPLAR